jgi:hypothetical protein
MPTRRSIILVVGGLIGVSGCSGVSDETTEGSSDPTNEPVDPPSPDHRTVKIRNNGNQSKEVEIEVSKEGQILYEGTHSISAGDTKLIYNTSTDGLGSSSIDVKASTDTDNITRIDSGAVNQPPIEVAPSGNLTAPRIMVSW